MEDVFDLLLKSMRTKFLNGKGYKRRFSTNQIVGENNR